MKFILCAAASVLALANTAQATERTFQFTSSVKQIVSTVDFSSTVYHASITLPFGTAKIGDEISATVTYDTSAAGGPIRWGGANYAPPTSSYMTLGNGTLVRGSAGGGGVIWVYDNDANPSGDSFGSYYYFGSNDSLSREMIGVTLDDPSGKVLTGYQLPGSELTTFNAGTFAYIYEGYTIDDSGYHNYSWTISGDITAIAAVPEPGTYAMLLAGLGLVAWRRKRA